MQSKLLELVHENRPLFWSVGVSNLDKLDETVIVETILNLGNVDSTKRLMDIMGIDKVAQVFFKHSSQHRNNYYPQVSHFFDLYFKRHVPKYSQY